ncbi:MAG: hypothetical protein IJM41_06755 [Bacteroidales bacterium]|nr:hypothetical protein [Bacteroidales bacterium]
MKRILLISAAFFASVFSVSAGDYDNGQAIVISERSKLFLVNHLGLGMVYAAGGPEQMKSAHGLDFCLDFFSFQYELGPSLYLDTSLGVEEKAFRIKGDEQFMVEDGILTFVPYPEMAKPKFSAFAAYSINVAAGLRYDLGNGLGLAFTPILGVPVVSRLKTKYRIDGDKQKDKSRETGLLNPVTCDLRLMLTFPNGSSGFYFKYSPTPLIKEARGPQFTNFSFGIII